ncbi:MAG: 4Fe-4S binding protein [Deltaproteobacteria bacterium]|nr:4Fe-4S binding protein [Deltaproteobacteria bacterium]
MAKGKVLFREDRCKGCSLCIMACPKKMIELSGRLNNQGYNVAHVRSSDECTGCAMCAEMCPDVVIEVFKD